jgi:hypothetical protein
MRRILLTLFAASHLTFAAAVVPTEPTPSETIKVASQQIQQLQQRVVKVATQPIATTQTHEDTSPKRYGILLATFAAMAAIAWRRTRSHPS